MLDQRTDPRKPGEPDVLSRTLRIRRHWEQLHAGGGNALTEALRAGDRRARPLRALLDANVEAAAALTSGQECEYRRAAAELFTIPDPAAILLAGFSEQVRPVLAAALAERDGCETPSILDYAVADMQLTVSDRWLAEMRRTRFRRSSADVTAAVAASFDAPTRRRRSPQNAAQTLAIPAQVATGSQLPSGPGTWNAAGVVTADQRQQRRETVARNIRRLLTDRGITAYRLARRLGVSDQQVSGWLHARHEPTGHLEEIAAALECTVADLYSENGA